LINQGINGLDVIEQTGMKRAVLVTSHYANAEVLNQAAKMGVRILPKQLATEVPIYINRRSDVSTDPLNKGLKLMDIVFVDDDRVLVDLMIDYAFKGQKVDKYHEPYVFLANADQYDRNTKICLDNGFDMEITGIDIAQILHEKGFKHLYLLSGEEINPGKAPHYLTVILKTDLERVEDLAKEKFK
jgi:hypothetical protein